MSKIILRPLRRVEACQLCEFISTKSSPSRLLFRRQRANRNIRQFSTQGRVNVRAVQSAAPVGANWAKNSSVIKGLEAEDITETNATQQELQEVFHEVKIACRALLTLPRAPTEEETVFVLGKCNMLAQLLIYEPPLPPSEKITGAASALLTLDEATPKKLPTQTLPQFIQQMNDELSDLTYNVVKHPPVFISPGVLELYVQTQSFLGKSRTFPEVFSLYARKPIPIDRTDPLEYRDSNPDKVSNAVPTALANRALEVAIDNKELITAMDIIENSYNTKAFHRGKFVRKGLFPAIGLVLAPVAAYTIASKLALLQTTMDNEMATNVAFVGIVAYVGLTATIGVVAVTTANDQMDRVTWAQGVPLRERWIREEERAAIDKVAGAWGFRETWRRGEEEGEEWDALKEWIGYKGMLLDQSELMDGME